MAYTKTTWVNKKTPLNATNMNHIEDGVAEAVNNGVNKTDAQTITGAKTFTSPIKTSEIDNTAGNAMLRDKSTEGAIVLGSVSKKAVIMGSGDRPTYSKDGSDFAGSELALLSDISGVSMSTLLRSLGDRRWQNKYFTSGVGTVTLSDPLLSSYPSGCNDIFSFSTAYDYNYGPTEDHAVDVVMASDTKFNKVDRCIRAFEYFTCHGGKMTINIDYIGIVDGFFKHCDASEIYFSNTAWEPVGISQMFISCTNLTTIGEFSAKNVKYTAATFLYCNKLKTINITHWPISFNIASSTAFEEADLVKILNNLDPVSTTQTLTMGATNLAKLTSDDILIATGKGWALA